MAKFIQTIILAAYCLSVVVTMAEAKRRPRVSRKQYSMYVWTTGYDVTISGCDVTKFMEWNSKGECFTHTWNTNDKRTWLWNTCNSAGREIGAIFVSDVHHNLKHAYDTGDCTTSDIALVKQMLTEGHSQVCSCCSMLYRYSSLLQVVYSCLVASHMTFVN